MLPYIICASLVLRRVAPLYLQTLVDLLVPLRSEIGWRSCWLIQTLESTKKTELYCHLKVAVSSREPKMPQKRLMRPPPSHLGLIIFAYHQVVDVRQTSRNDRRSSRGEVIRSCPNLSHLERPTTCISHFLIPVL